MIPTDPDDPVPTKPGWTIDFVWDGRAVRGVVASNPRGAAGWIAVRTKRHEFAIPPSEVLCVIHRL